VDYPSAWKYGNVVIGRQTPGNCWPQEIVYLRPSLLVQQFDFGFK